MQSFPITFVWRHRRENLNKCSLRGLESRSDFQFFSYPNEILPNLTNYIMLKLDAPPLSSADGSKGLFVIDATWRYAEKMVVAAIEQQPQIEFRSIPDHYRTAYPRRQDDCFDPERGLASIEAIYISYVLLGRDVTGLLDGYHWKDKFLKMNGF